MTKKPRCLIWFTSAMIASLQAAPPVIEAVDVRIKDFVEWIDPVKNRIYLLMIQRADMGNSDASEIRRAFQEAAKP